LTIAVSKPGEAKFSRLFVIRHAKFPGDPGESRKNAGLSQPCANEHDGKLYVRYSNSRGNVGRKGTGRAPCCRLTVAVSSWRPIKSHVFSDVPSNQYAVKRRRSPVGANPTRPIGRSAGSNQSGAGGNECVEVLW
jgi:hypothetical protein